MESKLNPLYRAYFKSVLCRDGEELDYYERLFDFRDATLKRREFNSSVRAAAWSMLEARYGRACQLLLSPKCEPSNPTVVDHLIPHSSATLNKTLNNLRGAKGKKVPNESFGSNDINNLALACRHCNALKLNKIEPELLRRVLKERDW